MTSAPPPAPLSFLHRLALKITGAALGAGKVPSAFVEALVAAAFRRSDTAAVESLARELARTNVPDWQVIALLRASLSSRVDQEMPQSLIEVFEEISRGCLHYSQEGEDILLARLLPSDKSGFFVDIGAHHPTRFSNTYALYRKGWRGINVDATPGSMELFRKWRPGDINLECAISSKGEPMIFHIFKEGALNTFDRELAQEYVASGWQLTRTIEIRPRTLSSVLVENLPTGKEIDLFSIDVEGEEMGVLTSNDWAAYRPRIIVLEALATPFSLLQSHPAIAFLVDKGYEPMSKLFNSVVLQRRA